MGNLDWVMPYIVRRLPLYHRSVEVCCGRGELIWATQSPDEEIMNDKDPNIIRIHTFVQKVSNEDEELDYFKRHYDWILTKKTFDFLKKGFVEKDDFDFAYRYLYMQRGGKNANSVYKDYFLLNLEGDSAINIAERIRHVKDRIRNVKFTNLDAIDCIQKFDSPETFFFIDPPYPSRERYYTVCNLDWNKFYEVLKSCQAKWMMVYDPHIENRIKHLEKKRRAYATECQRIALKILEENNHVMLEQAFKMKYLWKNSVGSVNDTKKYYIVCNYKILDLSPKMVDLPLEWEETTILQKPSFPKKLDVIQKIDELTSIEEYNGIFYKRDDLFKPFTDSPLNGGKTRQALSLIQTTLDIIRKDYNSTVSTACSVHSAQGVIIARIAKEYNLKFILVVSGKSLEDSLSRYKSLRIVKDLGGDIRVVSKLGYNNVLNSKLNEISKSEKSFTIAFGMNYKNYAKSIIETNVNQVRNIPQELDSLVIPVGSGVTSAGILSGLRKFDKQVKNIILVQIAGFDRTKEINEIVNEDIDIWEPSIQIPYKFIRYGKYPYSKWLDCKISDDFSLDGRYEAKAHEWMLNNKSTLGNKILFWVIGNTKEVV